MNSSSTTCCRSPSFQVCITCKLTDYVNLTPLANPIKYKSGIYRDSFCLALLIRIQFLVFKFSCQLHFISHKLLFPFVRYVELSLSPDIHLSPSFQILTMTPSAPGDEFNLVIGIFSTSLVLLRDRDQ